MANSSMIGTLKNKVIKSLIQDELIVKAIDSPTIKKPEDLINTHIFNYHQNPYTLENVQTFLTVQVHIPDSYDFTDRNRTFIKPTLEIWILSHHKHMKVNNISKVTDNRNDYISELLDIKLNGADYGYGGLKLISNVEGSYQEDYLWRKMTFVTNDLNQSKCEDE